MNTQTLSLLERCYAEIELASKVFPRADHHTLLKDIEAAIAAERSKEQAKPQQEPVYCWTWDKWIKGGEWEAQYGWEKPEHKTVNLQPLYASPQSLKPLSDEEIITIRKTTKDDISKPFGISIAFARAIEAKLGVGK